MFFKGEVFSIQEKAVGFREFVDIHPKMCGKTLSIAFLQINKTGLFAACAAALALKFVHADVG